MNIANNLYTLYELCGYSILAIKCLISVYWNSFFEPFDWCKANLVILTAKVKIDQSHWLKLDGLKRITGTCKNQTGNKVENQLECEQELRSKVISSGESMLVVEWWSHIYRQQPFRSTEKISFKKQTGIITCSIIRRLSILTFV